MSLHLKRTRFLGPIHSHPVEYGYRLYDEEFLAEFCDGLSRDELDRRDSDFLHLVRMSSGPVVQSVLETLADSGGEIYIDGILYRLGWEAREVWGESRQCIRLMLL